MTRTVGLALAISFFFVTAVSAQPETHGTHTFDVWDAGHVTLDGTSIPVKAYYPTDGGGPFPVVAVVHGASRNMSYMAEMARTLASRGFVALTPTMPCGVAGCNHPANARQIRALLEWGIVQSAETTTPIAGMVDGERRGVIGHSWGGLGVFLAAQGHPEIDAVVVLDANDDGGMGAAAAPTLTQPSAHLMAQVMGACNSTNWKDTVFPSTPSPHMRLVVTGAGHCDVEDPTDGLCGFACTAGVGTSAAPTFRRYAVAFMGCMLQSDPEMAPYIGGSALASDTTAGTIQYVSTDGLDTLPCNGGVLADPDAGTIADDAAVIAPDAASSPIDAASSVDASAPMNDAATASDAAASEPASPTGCGCRAGGSRASGVGAALAVWMLALARRKRR